MRNALGLVLVFVGAFLVSAGWVLALTRALPKVWSTRTSRSLTGGTGAELTVRYSAPAFEEKWSHNDHCAIDLLETGALLGMTRDAVAEFLTLRGWVRAES